ncbi:hypothetical protein C8R43DRAFT_1026087 [Mycena crocata]|nr:hypothetical protein C8R43DRAFT_1026087 [Mycena crocata]
MMRAFTTALLLGLLAPFCIAGPIANKVLTPGGYRSNVNLLEIPSGGALAHTDTNIHVLALNGTVVHVAQSAGGAPNTATLAAATEKSGWITYASWSNTGSSPISRFTTTWTVPPAPKTWNQQTVFIFNSIEPPAGNAILQPVLQYGPSAAGGGEFWSVANWYVGDAANTFFTTPPSVRNSTGTNSESFDYKSEFSNIDRSALSISGVGELTWATETLEAYGITQASDYPTGATVLSAINLELLGGEIPDVSWGNVNDETDGLSTTVDSDGATNAQITITY